MSTSLVLGLAAALLLSAAVIGWFWLVTDLDEFFDRIDREDDEKVADGTGGDGRRRRPSEHNRT